MKRYQFITPLVFVFALAYSTGVQAGCISFHQDNFSNGLDSNLWNISGTSCASVSAAGGTLEFNKPSNRVCAATATFAQISNDHICGDFELSVEYELEEWPGFNNSSCRLLSLNLRDAQTNANVILVERVQFFGDSWTLRGESYKAFKSHNSNEISSMPTGDRKGIFKFVRKGNVLRVYIHSDSLQSWEQLITRTGSTADVYFQARSWTCGNDGRAHRVSLDNFSVRSPQNCVDIDGDGVGANGDPSCPVSSVVDCDDSNATIFPGAAEQLDALDNNCNGNIDEGLDNDLDGVANIYDQCPNTPVGVVGVNSIGCEACLIEPDGDQDGFKASEDCNDLSASIYPGAQEQCNGIDDNCDGQIDEGFDRSRDFLECSGISDVCGPTPSRSNDWGHYQQCVRSVCRAKVERGEATESECANVLRSKEKG